MRLASGDLAAAGSKLMGPIDSESTERKKGNESVFVSDSIRDAKIADSRHSNRTSMAHGMAFPHMQIAVSNRCINS